MSFTVFNFSRNSWKNTTLSTPSGDVLYWIETSTKLFQTDPTIIYKPSFSEKGGREVVAQLEFHFSKKDRIVYAQGECAIEDLFVKKREWKHCTRLMSTEAGEMKWTVRNSGKPELRSAKNPTRRSLVRFHINRHFLTKSTPTLEVEEEALPFMDLVMMGWVVLMRDIENTTAAAAAG